LPSLRYHNLTLPIVVEQKLKPGPSFCPTMTLRFESRNKEDLENIETKPELSDSEALEKAKVQLQTRFNQERMAAIESNSPVPQKDRTTWVDVLRKEQEAVGTPEGSGTSIGQVQVKAQPAADPSAPSSASPPSTSYTREITLGLRGRTPGQIFSYFKHVTKARQYYRSLPDRRSKRKMDKFFDKADEDRERVKAGIDAMRREKEDLRRAREAADRLAADA
jgi:hypothetical protein